MTDPLCLWAAKFQAPEMCALMSIPLSPSTVVSSGLRFLPTPSRTTGLRGEKGLEPGSMRTSPAPSLPYLCPRGALSSYAGHKLDLPLCLPVRWNGRGRV